MTDTWVLRNTQREWERARRSAFVQDVLGVFTLRQADLLPFEQVRRNLKLRDARYLGLQDVPLDQIVGSVDRYQDFTRAFFPRGGIARDRWRQIARLAAVIDGKLPPVELYQVGQVYFVRDGHHRVSVARQQKMPCIEAYVWKYETRVPLEPDTAADDLLRKAAYAAFLERTDIDRFLCADMRIELTEPDGYERLLYEIEAFQQGLSQIDGEAVSFPEAVALWCEMCYVPIIEIVRLRNVLQEFPGRTEADLYLWLCDNQRELEARYGRDILIEEAADDLAERFGGRPSPARQLRERVGRVAEGLEELGSRLARSIAADDRAQEGDTLAAGLLAPIRRAAAIPPLYRFRGTTRVEWEAWRARFQEELWELLGVGGRPWRPFDPGELKAEVREQIAVDGLWCELVWLNTEADLRVPAYLYRLQEAEGLQPAVIVFPGHGTIAQMAGLEQSLQPASALELARAGFITLAVEPRGFGRLSAVGHLQIDAAARLVGRTWLGLLVQDGMRALDYLLARPDVDPARIGAAGIGAGGALAMYLAALDERVGAAVICGYLGRYVINSLDDGHCPCDHIPGILRYAEMGDVAALIAPRPVIFVNDRNDPSTNPGARESFATVCQVYQLLGVPRRARLIEPRGPRRRFDSQLVIGWLRRWLGMPG